MSKVLRNIRFLVRHSNFRLEKRNIHISVFNQGIQYFILFIAVIMAKEIDKSELKSRLTPLQYHVTQEKGTERPFSGCYNKTKDAGTYLCIVCEQPLFSSETKFDSGCGWPAFNDVLDKGKVKLSPDTSGGRIRTEVTCSQCGAHLGHVFGDGPPPTRKRFCINSASLNFIPSDEAGDS